MVNETWASDDGTSIKGTISYDYDSTEVDDWGEIEQTLRLLESFNYEWPTDDEIIEKIKWKDRTFNKTKTIKIFNVRRDTQGKSGRW